MGYCMVSCKTNPEKVRWPIPERGLCKNGGTPLKKKTCSWENPSTPSYPIAFIPISFRLRSGKSGSTPNSSKSPRPLDPLVNCPVQNRPWFCHVLPQKVFNHSKYIIYPSTSPGGRKKTIVSTTPIIFFRRFLWSEVAICRIAWPCSSCRDRHLPPAVRKTWQGMWGCAILQARSWDEGEGNDDWGE